MGLVVLALVISQGRHDEVPSSAEIRDETTTIPPEPPDTGLSEWFWPAYRRNPDLTAMIERLPQAELEPMWQHNSGNAIRGGVVVASGTVWLANRKGSYFALELETGRELWQHCLCHAINSTGLLMQQQGRSLLFFGSDRGKFLAVDAGSGELIYTFAAGGSIAGGASGFVDAGAGRVIFGSHDCFLYCLDAADGGLIFKYETDNFINGTPALIDKMIVLGGCDGFLRSIDRSTGSETARLDLGSYIPSSPAVSDGVAFLALHDGVVVAAAPATGEIKWKFEPEKRSEFFAPPAVNQDVVVAAASDGRIHVLERSDGRLRHSLSVAGKLESEPLLDSEKMLIADLDGFIYCFSLDSGELLWKMGHGAAIAAPLTAFRSFLLVADLDGRVTLYREKSQ